MSRLVRAGGFWVRDDNVSQDLVIVDDVYVRDAYKTHLLFPRPGGEVVFDIGAHIGTFATLWHEKMPDARIFCVEACPENTEALEANVGHFATVMHAACTYESDEVALLNAVRPNCESTGGSTVVPRKDLVSPSVGTDKRYWHDTRPIRKVTLEDLLDLAGLTPGAEPGTESPITLKLDCEHSEFSILGETPSLDGIGFIMGEYHDRGRWDQLRAKRFSGWDYGDMSGGTLGLFHFRNPR